MSRVIKRNMPKIEAALIKWSASGRVDGGVALKAEAAPRPAPSLVKPPKADPVAKAQAVVKRAVEELEVADMALQAADVKLSNAKSALVKALEGGAAAKKKKGKADPAEKAPPTKEELEEAVTACEEASARCREVFSTARRKREVAESALSYVRTEADKAAKLNERSIREAQLRRLHMKAMGRHLPCRLPHVLAAAREQVAERPDEILVNCEDMRTLLFSLSVSSEQMRGLAPLFRRIELEDMRDGASSRASTSGRRTPHSASRANLLKPAAGGEAGAVVSFGAIRRYIDNYCSGATPSPSPNRGVVWQEDWEKLRSTVYATAPSPAPKKGRPISAASVCAARIPMYTMRDMLVHSTTPTPSHRSAPTPTHRSAPDLPVKWPKPTA